MDENLKQYIDAVSAEDLPRIVRSDMTRMTEMLAKYRSIAQGAEDEVAEQVQTTLGAIAAARNALHQLTAVASGYSAPSLVGPGASPDSTPMPEGGPAAPPPSQVYQVGSGGVAVTLSTALAQAGFVSSSAVAKRGIRGGVVEVDGEQATTDLSLSPGETYELRCGEVGPATIKVR